MGKQYNEITPEIGDWIAGQHLFFVATAPLSSEGLINCSPKGMDTFRILSPTEVGYLDLTGSGIETAAHLRENRRIIFMFCAFSGAPQIMRFHGFGDYHLPGSPAFEDVSDQFPALPGIRGIVRAQLTSISDSCGFAVPRYEFVEDRNILVNWARNKGPDGLEQYRKDSNGQSIDGLPGLADSQSGAKGHV